MYALKFDGPVPAYTWYRDLATGVRARQRARSKGYHVTLIKEVDVDVERRDNDERRPTFADRLRTKFRRKDRGVL